MLATFKNLSNIASDITLGKGAPAGLFEVAANAGVKLGPADIKRMADNPEEMVQLLQKFFQSRRAQTDKAWANTMGRSFGLSDSVMAGMRKNAFRPEMLAKAPVYKNDEVEKLAGLDAQWKNLGTKWEMFFGKMNLAHGGELIKDLTTISDKVMNLINSFQKLAETVKLFDVIGKAFEGWGAIFDGITAGVDTLNKASEDPKKAKELEDSLSTGANDFLNLIKTTIQPLIDSVSTPEARAKQMDYLKSDKAKSYIPELNGGPDNTGVVPRSWPKSLGGRGAMPVSVPGSAPAASSSFAGGVGAFAAPPMPAAAGAKQPQAKNVEINQTLHFPGGMDPQKTADLNKQAVKSAYFSSPALSQGN